MTGAQFILASLTAHGCNNVFGYPGGAIMPLYDALLDVDIKHHLARHEQGAAFAAIGYARASGNTGVCFATSGPGFTNVLTALADAKLDSVPLLVISGQVVSAAMGSDAFQEVDTLGLSLSVCKHSIQVSRIDALPEAMEQALYWCQEGRPGPVLLDVTKDVLLTEFTKLPNISSPATTTQSVIAAHNKPTIARINRALGEAKRPLLYLGGGIAMANALQSCRAWISHTQIPAVCTLKGLGTLPQNYAYDLGMLGMHGLKGANLALQQTDLLVVIGARLDDRATGKLSEFAPNARLIHIDIDAAELHKRRHADIALTACCSEVLPELGNAGDIDEWRCSVTQLKANNLPTTHVADERINPGSLLMDLAQSAPNAIYTCDVGQHQMWAAQHLTFCSPQHHISSGGLGTMGFGLPAAIGAQVAFPTQTVINVSGDGSIMMNIQELATLKRYDLPVKILLLDNQRLGMVKQWQELFHEQRYSETDLSDNPEFSAIAKAFEMAAFVLQSPAEQETVMNQWLNHPGPALLHVKLNPADNVWPIVPPNQANHNMMESPLCTTK